ncbi:MAG: sigma-54-dependent transcriptional regulator [Nitrincola lacisaponensis]|uniref:Response regulator of zinc sigma-54-dependent two-component system n=1 Tax=Nitrincola lacisaponensis TaxID=267850 RepID=A0A063Y8D8_9GAMM|nr:sigma-54 dependent transcriptional regulator [Nitrincola lacisaponensis]KDE40981.1 Response regulator of zinc sigma-54-dependent two-component system [Nitrincola lacisaponensis]
MSRVSTRQSLLLVEDDQALAALILEELEAAGFDVRTADTLAQAKVELDSLQPALVITDLRLPDGHGMQLVERVMQLDEAGRPGLIVITAFGSVRQAVEALQAGADDFLTKPLDLEHFLLSVHKVLENHRVRDELRVFRQLSRQQTAFHGIWGKSQAIRTLFDQIRVVARAQGPVLINGESGTGKELVAKALHAESERADGPFLAVNCAGIPQELLESEFFGHAAGAFTGARKARKGLLQEAQGGTLLLDEIGEMPLTLQAKLLRALQDGSVRPVGQDTEVQVDVRIIAATHRDLKQKVTEGSFREDLYYRLETFAIQIPPLRQREDDLELLAQQFVRQNAVAQGKAIQGFSDQALALVRVYPFPGNVRELQNVVERAVAFCDGEWIEPRHLPGRLLETLNDEGPGITIVPDSFSEQERRLLEGKVLPTLDELQKRYVQLVLDEVQGNKRRAAALLGIGRRTLYRWLDQP